MTILLKQAFEQASQLPDDLQDQLAQEVLEDIAGELQWDTTLAQSEDLLEQLAAQRFGSSRPAAPVRRGSMSCELPSYRRFRRAFSPSATAYRRSAEELSPLEARPCTPQSGF